MSLQKSGRSVKEKSTYSQQKFRISLDKSGRCKWQ